MPTVLGIIVAAGSSVRAGSDKLEITLNNGKTVLENSVGLMAECSLVDDIVVVTREDKIPDVERLMDKYPKVCAVTKGGSTRFESVRNGISAGPEHDYICIHDAARPFASQKLVRNVIEKAFEYGAAAPCVPVKDTIKYTEDGFISGTPDRNKLRAVQTPQVFKRDHYLSALASSEDAFDDCQVMERAGYRIFPAEGEESNYKITTREDVEELTGMSGIRIGHGYDVHRLVEGRKLILCGVDVPYEKGLDGHSDADVAVHALMDAILGAAGLPDIGKQFPDNDPQYLRANSVVLLSKVMELISEKGWELGNADITIVCQKPKLAPFIPGMRSTLERVLGKGRVNIKATTEEKLGFTGSGEGIAAHAVALILG